MPAFPTSPENQRLTFDEFLAWEEQQDERHEFVDGEIQAMTGASIPHARIVFNLAKIFDAAIGDSGDCAVFDETVKLRCEGELFYPDVIVTCEEYTPGREWFAAPVVLAEVLSPSSHRRDRELKWSRYQRIPALEIYLLVAQHRPWVQAYRRTGDGWAVTIHDGLDAVIEVPHPTCSVALRDVYRRVPLALG